MTINGFAVVAFITYLIMLAAFFMASYRRIHIPIMISIMIFDMCVPVYLFLNRDWKARLIDSGDILSFSVWMHFGMVLTLYSLYIWQVHSAMRILKGDDGAKPDHRGQGMAILGLRAFVILTGTLLIDPELEESGIAMP